MKTIAVILPVNNPDMLNEQDLIPYQSNDYQFTLTYAETSLQELNTAADAATVLPSVLRRMEEAQEANASAIIVYAFGDVGIQKTKDLISIPVLGLGKAATHIASLLCRNFYTIIPGQLSHNAFIKNLVAEENLQAKFLPASHAAGLNPIQIKNNPEVLSRLVEAASAEIKEKNIDTFTFGCGCFMDVAKKLEKELRAIHQKPITVIDPVIPAFNIAKSLS